VFLSDVSPSTEPSPILGGYMRVTSGMLISNMMRNYRDNLSRIERFQNQLATGKNIRRPSDDPSGASKALKLRSDLSVNQQYIKNTDNALSWLSITETALRDVGDSIQRIRELTVRASTGTFTPENRAVVADEIAQVQQHIFQLSNSTYAGRYIFGGFRTDTPPFTQILGRIDFQGNAGEISFEVGVGIRIPVNVTGDPTGVDFAALYDTLENLRNDLGSPTMLPIDSYLADLDIFAGQALANRSLVGAKSNRFELVRSRLLDSNVNFTDLLSRTQDADIAEVMMNLKEAEMVYNASLATGARVIMPTLVDFLR